MALQSLDRKRFFGCFLDLLVDVPRALSLSNALNFISSPRPEVTDLLILGVERQLLVCEKVGHRIATSLARVEVQ
jgi:hypothetical protein